MLVCNNWRFVTVHNMLLFHDEPVIRENIIAKILFASCSAKISYRENFRVYGSKETGWRYSSRLLKWKLILKHLLSLFWVHLVYSSQYSSQNRNSKCFRINFHFIATLSCIFNLFPYYLIPNLLVYVLLHFRSLFPFLKLQIFKTISSLSSFSGP